MRLPEAELRQPFGLLLVRAPQVDRHRAQRDVSCDGDGQRAVDPSELLDRQSEREASAPPPPYSSGKGMPMRPSSPSLATAS